MNWPALLSSRRQGMYRKQTVSGSSSGINYDLRSEFEKDYHRIIGSAAFRRLQDKTQVFPWDKSDFIRTRLTHSLEVSSLAKSLAQNVGECILQQKLDPDFTPGMKEDISDILSCAGLIHDIGNPPFGHFGEEAIRDWFIRRLPGMRYKGIPLTELLTPQMLQDFYHFEGNAQALRLVSRLHFLVNEHGMNLTYALLNTVVKYPVSSLEIDESGKILSAKKMGFFHAEQTLYEELAAECGTTGMRHPLTYILEAADDIAYRTADIEDAYKKGCISWQLLRDELEEYLAPVYPEGGIYPLQVLERQYQKALERKDGEPVQYAISNFVIRMQGFLIGCATAGFAEHYDEIMAGTWNRDLFYGTKGAALCDALGKIAMEHAFLSTPILRLEVAAGKILDYFLDAFTGAFLYYDTDRKQGVMEEKLTGLVSEHYKQLYQYHSAGKSEAEKLYLRLLLVTDYVSGMTDTYARDTYRELNGI